MAEDTGFFLPCISSEEFLQNVKERAPKRTFIYLMLNERNRYVKIGKSSFPRFREKTLQSEEPEVILLAAYLCDPDMERELHEVFAHRRVRGEWFNLSFEEALTVAEHLATNAADFLEVIDG